MTVRRQQFLHIKTFLPFVQKLAPLLLCLGMLGNIAVVHADDNLAQRSEALKQRIIDLNRELFALEEEILYPANTQVVIYLSMEDKVGFELDSVELNLNGKLATSYIYSEREINALKRGGVQRLYIGSLASGPHRVEAVFNGRGQNDKYFRESETLTFEKQASAKALELRIEENSRTQLPRFRVKELD